MKFTKFWGMNSWDFGTYCPETTEQLCDEGYYYVANGEIKNGHPVYEIAKNNIHVCWAY